MISLKIKIPRGEDKLMEKLFLAEGNYTMKYEKQNLSMPHLRSPVVSMSFEVKDGATYRLWHINDPLVKHDARIQEYYESQVPAGLEWEWVEPQLEELEAFEDF